MHTVTSTCMSQVIKSVHGRHPMTGTIKSPLLHDSTISCKAKCTKSYLRSQMSIPWTTYASYILALLPVIFVFSFFFF